MKKLFFVMNPCAGMRKANKVLVDILSVFNRAGFDVITYITESRGDAAMVVAQRAKEMDLVVCCGGDGTFNETITGILRSGTDVPMGYIPAGSTNDFANSLHLSSNPVQAARDITEGVPVSYDLGKFADRYFSYVASFGAFTRASYSTPQNVKTPWGTPPTFWRGFKSCPRSGMSTPGLNWTTDGSLRMIFFSAPSAIPPASAEF